ncbi:hypothetical protein F6Y02_41705 (plasmid) [Bacillus megaterium]|nr:hypothetical protein [Priestia megaterium]
MTYKTKSASTKKGTTLVIRYTVTSQGQNKINDIVMVSDPIKGDESISIEADYFEMVNSHMIRVYVNHQLTTFKLSNYLEERHLNFGAGTKVLLTGVKTTDGTTIENISPL